MIMSHTNDDALIALILQQSECGTSDGPVLSLDAMKILGAKFNNFTERREQADAKYALIVHSELNAKPRSGRGGAVRGDRGGGASAVCGGRGGGRDSIPTPLALEQQMWQNCINTELACKIAQEQADYEVALTLQADLDGGRGRGRGRGGGGEIVDPNILALRRLPL
jgi:hypothetical protein